MTDENYEASAQAHLASIKRDMKASMEDAVVRAMHKVMAEFEAKSDERLMEDWGPGPHEVHSLPAREPEQPAQQEPVAWLHTKIEGVAVPHRPADLDKHPDRWAALYKEPKPCPTCEALARTVMLDQTSHDTTLQRTWVGLTRAECLQIEKDMMKYYDYQHECKTVCLPEFARAIEAKLKEKNT